MKNITNKLLIFFILTAVFGLLSVVVFLSGPKLAMAATNISSGATAHWAWNDFIGWMDFYNTDTITVNKLGLTGYASSSVGDISLDCATTGAGNICGTSNYQVLNDGNGNLSGWAWNDEVGWISFCGGQNTASCPGTTTVYQASIAASTGVFSGWAWNDVVGWFSFNCTNTSCPPNYNVTTSWIATSTASTLDSATFDTGISGGAQLNSVIWRGAQKANGTSGNTEVDFQFAGSNSSSGPWSFIGSGGDSSSYYTPSSPAVPLKVDYILHNNQRYFRYRIRLVSDQAQRETPRVDDVLLNWSP